MNINDLLKDAYKAGNAEKYNKISNYLHKNFNITGAEINLLILYFVNHSAEILNRGPEK